MVASAVGSTAGWRPLSLRRGLQETRLTRWPRSLKLELEHTLPWLPVSVGWLGAGGGGGSVPLAPRIPLGAVNRAGFMQHAQHHSRHFL